MDDCGCATVELVPAAVAAAAELRPGLRCPLEPGVVLCLADLILADPPAEAAHWTGAMTAGKTGVSVSSGKHLERLRGSNLTGLPA